MLDAQAQAQIQDFLFVLKKRRWTILLPAIFVFTLGSAFAFILPQKYVVDTTIEIKPSRNREDYQFRNPHESAAAREVENADRHIRHYKRIAMVIEADRKNWPEYHNGDVGKKDEIIQAVRKNIEVEVDEKKHSVGSTFVEITYRDPKKERAAGFLNALGKAWLEEVVAYDLITLQRERDAKRKQELEDLEVYDKLRSDVHALCRALELDPLDLVKDANQQPSNDPFYAALNGARSELLRLKGEEATARAERERAKTQWDREPPTKPELVTEPGVDHSIQILKLRNEIREDRETQGRYTRQNSRWETLERKIQENEALIDELLQEQQDPKAVEMDVPNEMKQEYRLAYDEAVRIHEGIKERIKHLEGQVTELSRQVDSRTEDYQTLQRLRKEENLAQAKWEETNLELAQLESAVRLTVEGAGKPYDIAKEAIGKNLEAEPNPFVLMAVALFVGLVLGIGLALVLEYGSNSYRTVTELAGVLSVPVLGAIEPIVTQAEKRRGQFRRAMVGFSTAVLVGGTGWLIYMYRISPEKLPIEILQTLDSIQLALM